MRMFMTALTLGLGVLLTAALGCDQGVSGKKGADPKPADTSTTKTTARASSASTSDAARASSVPTSAAATASAVATSSASAALAGGSVADSFRGDVPPGGTPRAILRGGKGTGVIVIMPSGFGPGSGSYGDGYGSFTAKSMVSFQLEQVGGIDPKVPTLSAMELKQLCYPLKVDNIKWEPSVDLTIGPESMPATVWKGMGAQLGDKKPFGAYAVSTVMLKNMRIRACGVWDSSAAEAEQGVIAALKSIRTGTAGPTDPGNP